MSAYVCVRHSEVRQVSLPSEKGPTRAIAMAMVASKGAVRSCCQEQRTLVDGKVVREIQEEAESSSLDTVQDSLLYKEILMWQGILQTQVRLFARRLHQQDKVA